MVSQAEDDCPDKHINDELENALKLFKESVDMTMLDLSSHTLYELPTKILQHVDLNRIREFSLEYNNLVQLPAEIGCFERLCTLLLNGNNLYELPKEICELKLLKELSVNENLLSELPFSLGELKCLRKFSAIGNKLFKLPASFSMLANLEEIYLDENRLDTLSIKFQLFSELQILELSDNELLSLSIDIGCAKKLRILNLNHNRLQSLPESLSDLECLEILDVSNNNLKELPEGKFASVHVIKKLYLECNNIKVLPQWCSKMTSIEEIIISDNSLANEPFNDEFCKNCTKLKILEAGKNYVECLSEYFGQLRNLESLHFGSVLLELERGHYQAGNWMKYLPDSFCQLSKLVKANLNENQLHSLPENFGDLQSLTWLDLGQNMIKKLPVTFSRLHNLEYLQLSKNLLEELPKDIGNFHKLIELRLDNNLLTSIPQSLGTITGLQALDLFKNHLEEIPEVIFHLKRLTRLDLDQNNFKVSFDEVPRIVPGLNYPKRDPNLKDNWRGKSRATDNMSPLDGEQKGVTWDERTLKMAIDKGASFWRSHTDRNYFQRLDAQINTDFVQQASTSSIDRNSVDHLKISNSGIITDDEISSDPCDEDWDREIALMEQYEKVEFTCNDRKTKTSHVIDAFQNSINRYPPALQAYSSTAYYDSFVYRRERNSPVHNPLTTANDYNRVMEGQFDDAD